MVPQAAALYCAFDVFVLSSRTEGTPISLFEAMAAGVPVVATRVGGVPDVITESEARLVPSESPQALAEAIEATLSQGEETRRRAAGAERRLQQHFAVGPWLDRYETLYRELAS
jgi:glycosyltransferase involved in cell wall biosynthesis